MQGCGIRVGCSEDTVKKAELRSVGTYNGVYLVREATKTDIVNVRSMGGYIPKIK